MLVLAKKTLPSHRSRKMTIAHLYLVKWFSDSMCMFLFQIFESLYSFKFQAQLSRLSIIFGVFGHIWHIREELKNSFFKE